MFAFALENFERMKGHVPIMWASRSANLLEARTVPAIKELLPKFTFLEAPEGEDPDKRDYIVSNQRLLATGFATEWPLERGIRELIKGYTILRNGRYSNV